jgi:HlyD family secretion protein
VLVGLGDNDRAMTTRQLGWRAAILLAVVGGAVLLRATVFAPKTVPVRIVAVEQGRVEETVTNSRAGTVKARRRAKLAPEIGGRVIELPRRRGALVKKDELLLRVDDTLQRAQLRLSEDERQTAFAQRDQACLAAERAVRERDRTRSLAAQGIVSTDLVDGVDSQARTTEAACRAAGAMAGRSDSAVALARAQLDKTVLRAPFDGVVADTFIEEGEWTAPSPPALPIPPVLDLIDMRSIYVSAPMDEVDSGRIKKGQPARVSVDSQPGKHFAAHVVAVAPYVLDRLEQNRTVEIELELDEPGATAGLLPGTSADAEVILSARDAVLRVPTQALLEGGRVLVLEGDVLVERTLKVGLRNWDWSEIASGLTAGDRVVTSLDRPEVKAGARARAAEADRR